VNLNQLDASQGLEVPVVNEFFDVFLEELSVMPLDWDIEFVIELVSGIVPICKRPHRMTARQLAELKYQIKELLEKGYICPSSPLGEPLGFLSQRRMVLKGCVCIIVLRMRSPSRTSTRYLGLMICLVNSVVRVCSLKSIFDRDRIR
jgi:hypothetical protein